MNDVTQNWPEIEERLQALRQAYSEIGSAGLMALSFCILPLQDRFNKGERTRELAEEIMAVSL